MYARHLTADDDVWAEDYDTWSKKDAGAYGQAASAEKKVEADKAAASSSGSKGWGWGGNGASAAKHSLEGTRPTEGLV